MVLSEKEKRITAYHEGGHALVMLNLEHHDPLHKVTIVPRGRALGLAHALPEQDKHSMSRIELQASLASLFGGRVAEELIFGDENVTTGAASDIQQATRLARRMVTEWGFSQELGPLRYADNEEEVFLGHSVAQRKNVSDETARIIDSETRRLVDDGESTARRILTERLDDLHTLAKALLEHETLNRLDIEAVLRGETINRDTGAAGRGRPGRAASVPPTGERERGTAPMGIDPEPQPEG